MGQAVRVAFRTDAGCAIGLGHLGRCLALAHVLRTLGAECLLLLDGDHPAWDFATASGLELFAVTRTDDPGATVDWCRRREVSALVVDSYTFSASDLRALLATDRPVVVFDDTARRELPVDLVINGGIGATQLPYRGGPHTRYLLGPRYLALRPEFAEATPRTTHPRVGRALVTLGGTDPGRLTARLVRWAIAGLGAVTLDVVVGPLVDDVASIRTAVASAPGNVVLHESPKHLRDLMRVADLALAGGGHTVYELAATGTPTVAIRLAENQALNIEAMRTAGALAYAGDVQDPALGSVLVETLAALAVDPGRRAHMSHRGRALVDGLGADRLARAVLDLVRS